MKTSSVIFVLALILTGVSGIAQPAINLPPRAEISHFTIPVGYYKTTVLIFPAAIDTADRGSGEIIAEKQAKLENVLKVKAAYQGFSPTNLHIFTVDRRIFAFDVVYSDSPIATTFDLSSLPLKKDNYDSSHILLLSKQPLTSDQWKEMAAVVKDQHPDFKSGSKREGIRVRLESIYQEDSRLLFCFSITNKTNLPFEMSYANLQVSDRRKMRRSSVQERQLAVDYSDSLTTIPGKSAVQWFMAAPQFTVSGHRALRWTVGEENGERSISLRIKNRYLFRVKDLSSITPSAAK